MVWRQIISNSRRFVCGGQATPVTRHRFSPKVDDHGHQDPQLPDKMTGCGRLCSKQQHGLSHMPKRTLENRGNGTRMARDGTRNTLLLARHAVFRNCADARPRPARSGIFRNFGELLSRCNNWSPVKSKKVPARALFSVSTMVQSLTRRRNSCRSASARVTILLHHY